MNKENQTTLSIIVSVYNEQEGLVQFWNTLKQTIKQDLDKYECQVIFVNDGSTDKSQSIIDNILNQENNIKIKSIEFSRNYGHEAAMIAGIDNCNDDIAVCLDADLQHPPDRILSMIKEWENDADIVLMNRTKRQDNTFLNRLSSKLFYKTVNFLSETRFESNASDFFLISKRVATVLKNNYRERNRFLRGYIQMIGYNITSVEYESPDRNAGTSNYNFRKLFSLGVTAIFAFSNKPLKISLIISFIFFIFSTILIIYSICMYLFGSTIVSGYTTIIISQSIGFTVLSFIISILSIYFGKSLSDIRDRPIYLVKNVKTK